MPTEVHDAPDRSRYEVTVDGTLAGFAEYRDRGTIRTFTHTEVFDAYEGKGVGALLARQALDDVRAAGRTVIPRCPFIRAWIDHHPDYADLVVSSPGSRRPG
jgi:predicted GNAT family acetyltransferase